MKYNLTDFDDEDSWAIKSIKRHYKWIGFRRYMVWNSETDKWYRSIHFQFLDKYDKEVIRWSIKKGLW